MKMRSGRFVVIIFGLVLSLLLVHRFYYELIVWKPAQHSVVIGLQCDGFFESSVDERKVFYSLPLFQVNETLSPWYVQYEGSMHRLFRKKSCYFQGTPYRLTHPGNWFSHLGYVDVRESLDHCHRQMSPFTAESSARFVRWISVPRKCQWNSLIVDEYPVGLGANLHVKAFQYMEAMSQGRSVLHSKNTGWPFANCTLGNLECYFEPFTECLPQSDPDPCSQGWTTACLKSYSFHWKRVIDLPSGAPVPFGSYNFWRSNIMAHMLRPKTDFVNTTLMPSILRVFGHEIPHPLLSVYVRHGDKHLESRLHPTEAYIDAILCIRRRLGIRHVYIGSDNASALVQMKSQLTKVGITIYLNDAVDRSIANGVLGAATDGARQAYIGQAALQDLFLSIQGDVFLGTLNSNWCRIIDELRLAFRKTFFPYIDLDRSYFMMT